jgi:hypothetical protein
VPIDRADRTPCDFDPHLRGRTITLLALIRADRANSASTSAAVQAAPTIATEPEPELTLTCASPAKKRPWPKPLAEQVKAVGSALATSGAGMTPEQLDRTFQRAPTNRVAELLETLISLYQDREWTTIIVLRGVLGKKPLDELSKPVPMDLASVTEVGLSDRFTQPGLP